MPASAATASFLLLSSWMENVCTPSFQTPVLSFAGNQGNSREMRVWPHFCTRCNSWLSPESASSVSSKCTCLIHGTRQAVCLYNGGRPCLAPEHKHLRSQSSGRESKVSRAAQTTRASLIPPHNATQTPPCREKELPAFTPALDALFRCLWDHPAHTPQLCCCSLSHFVFSSFPPQPCLSTLLETNDPSPSDAPSQGCQHPELH